MKKAVALLAVLIILAGVVVPTDAWARGWRGGGHHGGGWHHGCCWGWWWPGAIIGGLALGAAVAATYPPYAYAAPPVVYQPAPVSSAPPVYSAPAVQREVVYPHGRYVLYGDG